MSRIVQLFLGGDRIRKRNWKVGELAKRTGITVRTLHHYDQIGLFSPSENTEAGHRLYTEADVAKLHQIMTLKQLGFSLEDIKLTMNESGHSLREMMDIQLAQLNDQIEFLTELRSRIEGIDKLFLSGEHVSSERLMMAILLMRMTESRHFKAPQSEEMKKWFSLVKENELEELQAEGARLLSEFRRLYEKGMAPHEDEVRILAKIWSEKMSSWVHINEEFIHSAEQYYAEYPDDALSYGMDRELYNFIKQAVDVITTDA
ncbi:MerR family transcriptional regulator [Paenibacillus sp. ISL-20]|uniref:MerR family transcriptional regulator n=1 Tax=Paenibacillus sp. ISL-20 TaxID=2819163 RepID=UPI001BED28BE|nr:MerR family transcriptional regulator [Paenibacillus sp. ISL-20]MBT2762374.1 MerR family transcriptional regulator [Paenibacillus sp. ISL-20]